MGLLNWIATTARRLASETRGNVAMIFGLSLPVLVLMTVGGVDIHRASTVRVNLQDALDAATLAAARSSYTTDADLTTVGMAALKANLQAYPNVTLLEASTTFHLNSDQVVIADARVNVKTLVANIFLPPYGQFMDDYLPVGAHSEVNRSSKNLEVALVLDITGSMGGSKISDLKDAAKALVDIVVQDLQTPYYSKMSVVPYSMGVNVGGYASNARGTPTGSVNISGASWSTGSTKSISNITRANPGVVTSNGHGFQTGDYVWIEDVSGMYQINDHAYRVVRINNNSFSLEYWNGSSWSTLKTRSQDGYSSYSRNGDVTKCQQWDCSVVVTTSSNHGIADGETVYITNVSGMTGINNQGFEIVKLSNTTFSVGQNGSGWGTYSSGGKAWCGRDGCQWRVFRNPYGALRSYETSTCVSERTGAQAYTDASPSTNRVGRNYPAPGHGCPSAQIQPLSSDKGSLKTMIGDLAVGGSTAAQIGTAWGWYSVSPNFNGLWPSSAAGAYHDNNLLKAVIIMTDGEFNTPYCTGVIAADADSGSGSTSDHIGCNATNGDPFDQTAALCAAMRAQGVIVYTVGFQMDPDGRGAQTLNGCANSGSAFLPASGADLTEAFKAIGRDITRLRISR